MSNLRPECEDGTQPKLSEAFALKSIYYAVLRRPGLCEGKLRDNGSRCVLGAFWDDRPGAVLATRGRSGGCQRLRSLHDQASAASACILRWLRWKLDRLGVSGIRGPR